MGLRAELSVALCCGMVAAALPAAADLPPEEVGAVLRLPEEAASHWVWVPDRLFRHSALFDGDTGRMLGALDSGVQVSPKTPLWSRVRKEIYTVDTVYSRGHRGERKDYVVIYDARTLQPKADIEVPPRTMDTGTGIALFGMLDEDRFLVVLNHSPGASVSVVDLESRRATAEIQTQGCAGVYPAGPRQFGMLCGDGTAMTVHLDDAGTLDHIARSPRFFDAVTDPITEKGARGGGTWWFASFEGMLYEIDFSGEAPSPKVPWSLFSEDERVMDWRIGGAQHLAYHPATGRLYSIVHRGEPGSHKDPGPEIWVYDVSTKKKTDVFVPENLMAAFLAPQVGFEADSMLGKLLDLLLPNMGVHSIAVTEDETPLLFYRHADLGALGVMDALTGLHLRDIEEVGLSGTLLVVP